MESGDEKTSRYRPTLAGTGCPRNEWVTLIVEAHDDRPFRGRLTKLVLGMPNSGVVGYYLDRRGG
jgi:hypothetical protein